MAELFAAITGVQVGGLLFSALLGGLLLYHMVSRALRKTSLTFLARAGRDKSSNPQDKRSIGFAAAALWGSGWHLSVSLTSTSLEN